MTDDQYIDAMYSMFDGPDETVIECRTVKLVRVRRQHPCMCPAHTWSAGQPHHFIRPGDRAVCDRAIADGFWGSCYVCLPCLKSWRDICNGATDYTGSGDYCSAYLPLPEPSSKRRAKKRMSQKLRTPSRRSAAPRNQASNVPAR